MDVSSRSIVVAWRVASDDAIEGLVICCDAYRMASYAF